MIGRGAVPAALIPDSGPHGVSLLARQLAAATGAEVVTPERWLTGPPVPVHLHFTELLWGDSAPEAARCVTRIAASTSVTVTLHDVPQPAEGRERHGRRTDAYRAVIAASDAVACNSDWERSLVADLLGHPSPASTAVIPLPIVDPSGEDGASGQDGVDSLTRAVPIGVGIAGFVYPGKGHAEAIDAVATLGADLEVVAIGGDASGHGDELESLRARAADRRVPFSITGHLGPAEFRRRLRDPVIPLAAHRHVSASGSIGSWIAAGRRPLVPASPYGEELAGLRPGTVSLYERSRLADAIARALEAPPLTWLAAGTAVRPDLDDVAAAYLRWWSELAVR